jgi:hypothetical protein
MRRIKVILLTLFFLLSIMKQKEWKPTRQEKSKSEMAAYGTMFLLAVVSIVCIIVLITTLMYG